jgi:hypothetical protein
MKLLTQQEWHDFTLIMYYPIMDFPYVSSQTETLISLLPSSENSAGSQALFRTSALPTGPKPMANQKGLTSAWNNTSESLRFSNKITGQTFWHWHNTP